MTDDLFPGRLALAAFGGVSDDWMVAYREGWDRCGRVPVPLRRRQGRRLREKASKAFVDAAATGWSSYGWGWVSDSRRHVFRQGFTAGWNSRVEAGT